MASLRLRATIQNLPDDVLSKIFIRLLAKQLAQMRCVSKSWNALLSQSSFIKSHLQHSIRNNDTILLLFYVPFCYFSVPFSAHRLRSPDLELANFIKLPVDLEGHGARVGGSVNGLVCLYKDNGDHNPYAVQIWNPSLSAVLTLPPYSMHSSGHDPIDILFWFGFDPKTDDYKVVKLASLLQPLTNVFKEWLQVEVYSMKKGSWQLITQRVPSHITGISEEYKICVNGHEGHLHWLGSIDEKKGVQTIVAFDLGVETFHEIPLPDSILDHNVSKRVHGLGVLAGKLCVVSTNKDGECEVWVMDEYWVAESWVKHHVFSQFSGNIHPYGFTLRDKFLFEDDNDHLALFDPIAAEVNLFQTTTGLGVVKVVDYVDSLVWVAPSERDISSCSSIS